MWYQFWCMPRKFQFRIEFFVVVCLRTLFLPLSSQYCKQYVPARPPKNREISGVAHIIQMIRNNENDSKHSKQTSEAHMLCDGIRVKKKITWNICAQKKLVCMSILMTAKNCAHITMSCGSKWYQRQYMEIGTHRTVCELLSYFDFCIYYYSFHRCEVVHFMFTFSISNICVVQRGGIENIKWCTSLLVSYSLVWQSEWIISICSKQHHNSHNFLCFWSGKTT